MTLLLFGELSKEIKRLAQFLYHAVSPLIPPEKSPCGSSIAWRSQAEARCRRDSRADSTTDGRGETERDGSGH